MQFSQLTVLAAGFFAVFLQVQSLSAQSSSSATPPSPPAPGAAGKSEASVSVPTTGERGPIRVQVNEVIVPVTVTDEKGRFVSDLQQKDFQIFEENKTQTIDRT